MKFFTNGGGGHRFMKVFHKIPVFFEGWLPLGELFLSPQTAFYLPALLLDQVSSELSAAGAKLGVRFLQLADWSPPNDPF